MWHGIGELVRAFNYVQFQLLMASLIHFVLDYCIGCSVKNIKVSLETDTQLTDLTLLLNQPL